MRQASGRDLISKIVMVRMVSHTRAGGDVVRSQVAVLVGDNRSLIGFGMHTDKNFSMAREHAIKKAEKNVREVPHVDGIYPYDFILNRAGVHCEFRSYRGIGRIVANPYMAMFMELMGLKSGMLKVHGRVNMHRILPRLIDEMCGRRQPGKVMLMDANNMEYRFSS